MKAVSNVLLPTFGDAIGGRLQKLLPVVNTLQFSTATGQENLNSAAAFLDNLNVAAGKQLGDKIFLRLNGGVCRGSTGGSDLRLTGGLSAEYRITRTLLAQVGMDQGASPCTQIGGAGSLPRWPVRFRFVQRVGVLIPQHVAVQQHLKFCCGPFGVDTRAC